MTHKTFFNICFVLLALLFPLTMQAQPKNLLDCRVLLFPHGEIEEGKAFAEECMSEHGYPKFAEEDNIMIAGYYTFPMGQRILSDYNIKKSIWTFEPVDNGYYIRNEDNGYLSYQKYGDGPYVGSGIDNAVKFRVTIDEKDNCHINIRPFNGIDGFPNEFDLVNADDCIIQVNGIKYIIYENCKKATIIPNLIDEDNSNDYKGEIIIPEKFNYKGVEYTVTNAKPCVFAQNQNITRISLPQSIKALSNCCFSESSRITSVEVPSVSIIGENAFSDCLSLTTVNMPSVTSIGTSAFSGCSSLSSIDIPSSVTSIGTYAFRYCSSLTAVAIPSSVTCIDNGTFLDCTNLITVDMPSVTSIRYNAFSGCSSLADVSMPSVVIINSEAFYGCSSLAVVNLPNTLESIGGDCFIGTRTIMLAATTPPRIETDAFWKNTIIKVPASAVNAYQVAAGWCDYKDRILSMDDITDYDVQVTAREKESGLLNVLTQDNLNKVVSLKVTGTINSYDIMLMRNKMPILLNLDLTDAGIVANDYEYYTGSHTEDNAIGENMFFNLSKIETVKLPKNATIINGYAFYGCDSLKNIVLPEKLEAIGPSAFSGCWRLKVIEFPSALKSIGFGAFSGCSQLEHIKLPSMLKTIGSKAFSDCSRLKNIELPPTLKTIDDNTFSGCSNLEKISLPGVETINGFAFNGCSKLSEVRIPSTLKSIGDGAFDCGNLKRVYTYTIEPVNIRQSTFSNYATATLYVPKQAYKNYYYNTQWSQFPTPMEFDEPYKYFYLNKEYTLEDRFTGEPDIDINPGGGIIVPGKPEQGDQDADTIHIKGDGKNWASIIANANLNAKGLYIDITIKANRWYFFSFPFKVRKADISCGKNVKFVFRTYNGAIRAKYGKGGWIDLDSSEEYLYPGKGYIFQASLDCTLSIKIEKNEFGKLPNVNVDTKLDIHTSTNEQNASWNFVGNPFTAFYDINDMGYTSPITRWNSDSNTYEAVRPGDDNAFLNPFEAFFVQCPKDNGVINFGGDNRLTQTGRDKKMNSQMQKARMEGQFDVQRQIVNLTLSDGTTTDKTRVVFNPDKKAGYERDCDAAKFESNGASELYSVEALAGRLAINERPEGSVKIGYRAAKAGEYTIAAQRMDRQVLLRDNDLQITFDLTQGDYHFTSDAGEFDNRFMLLIDNSTTGIGDIVTTTGVNVKPTDCGLNISNLQGKTLHVYALDGALYATRTQDGFLGLAKGIYLVEVEGLKAKFMVR